MIRDNFYYLIIYKYRPGPSTSSSTAVDKTERSEQSEVQNIPKSSKSSTLETQLKQKKDGNLNIYSLCLYYVM